jgi:hypothetical protein
LGEKRFVHKGFGASESKNWNLSITATTATVTINREGGANGPKPVIFYSASPQKVSIQNGGNIPSI